MLPELDVFVVPILDKYLVYAPLPSCVALVNYTAVRQLQQGLLGNTIPISATAPISATIQPLLSHLSTAARPPQMRTGTVTAPFFLGIIPTRGCNMACAYCDFAAPKQASPVMDLQLARTAVDAYFNLLSQQSQRAAVHFFGGEPFFAADVVHFVVAYATMQAAERGLSIHFEVTTNGLHSERQCRWIADHFDTVVLSLDGLADVQNEQRPAVNGRTTFATIARSARILCDGSTNLVLRACVTQDSVTRMVDFAHWICQHLSPKAVCFETLMPSPLAVAAGMAAPNPWAFARQFDRAATILADCGIDAVLSTADTTTRHLSFCPVGQDALIVTPDGLVTACYLLPEQWQQAGLNLCLGRLQASPPTFALDETAVQRARQLHVNNKPLCAHCFCRYHCAGGCHVNHNTTSPPGAFDDWCIQTRSVTITQLLRQLGQHDLVTRWLADDVGMETAVYQPTDRLLYQEIG